MRYAFAGFAFSALVTAISSQAWLTCLVLAVSGACWVLALSLFNTTVQLSTPGWVVGRALSLYQTMTSAGLRRQLALGVTAEQYGAANALMAPVC